MDRYIEVTLRKRGVSCVARMLDDLAPKTCEAVWNALPQESDAFHAKYASNEVYCLVPPFAPSEIGLENPTIMPIPGDHALLLLSARHHYQSIGTRGCL